MKCLVPILAISIFIIQIHSIYISHIPVISSSEICDDNSNEKIHDDECVEDSKMFFLTNCILKCGLAFLAGALFSDMKFIKFGVIW